MLAGIPIVDAVRRMDQIRKERVFFIALPIRMKRVSATWTRAIAIEEIDCHTQTRRTPLIRAQVVPRA